MAEVGERAADPRVAPRRILTRHPHDEFGHRHGTEFDSSYERNEPAEFGLGQVIPCWTEGVQMIKVGGKAELVCPADLAYGQNGQPNIPANSTLVFEVELLAIVNEISSPW